MKMQETRIEDRIKVVSITLLSLELQFDMCVEIISLTTDVVEGYKCIGIPKSNVHTYLMPA